ncbi:MAG: hypothetical protein K2J67_07885 [Lachnospiraceae bacterium]|nr:hypothetical protein [Lachnospiraceae bacterium]
MKHITDREIQQYYAHEMKEAEERDLLEHISGCEYCAGRWANAFPIQELLTPPVSLRADLEEQIWSEQTRSGRIPVKRMQSYRAWYQYCAKVILAMGLAITVLFLGDFRTEKQEKPNLWEVEQSQERNVSGQISKHTEKFSDAIKDWSESIGKGLRGEPQK